MRDTAQLGRDVGIEVAIAAADRAKRNVHVSVEGALGRSINLQLIIAWPFQPKWQRSSQLLLLIALWFVGRQRSDEGFLRNLNASHHLHALLTFFLLLEQLALSGDVTAVTLC